MSTESKDRSSERQPGWGNAALSLDAYNGGAIVVDASGTLLAANDRAAVLDALLRTGGELAAAAAEARRARSVLSRTLVIPEGTTEITVELTLIPDAERGWVVVLGRDLTVDLNLRSALVESRQRFKDLVECSSDFAWEVGPDRRFAFVSARGALGYSAEDLVGRTPDEMVIDPGAHAPLPFTTDRPLESIEMWMRRRDGSTACVVASSLPLFSETGEWRGARGVCRDATADRAREAALSKARHREQLLNYVVSTIRDELEPSDMLTTAATATARAMGASGSRIHRRASDGSMTIGASFGETNIDVDLEHLVADAQENEDVLTREQGEWNFLCTATRYHQAPNGAICLWKRRSDPQWTDDDRLLITDVATQLGIANEQIGNHERIVRLSRTDSLTGLLNRRAFYEEELPRRMMRLAREGSTAALLYVDMDNFKVVNDVHGHQRGDEAILTLRDMMLDHTRPGDTVARLGGDEFAVWLDNMPEDSVRERVHALVEAAYALRRFSGSEDRPLAISVGVAIFDPELNESMDHLLARADAAMYEVKRTGKGQYRIAPAPLAEPALGPVLTGREGVGKDDSQR